MFTMLNLGALALVLPMVSATYYCATVNSNAVSGYYALKIENGVALHGYNLDLSAASSSVSLASCTSDGQSSLQFHLHEAWVGLSTTSALSSCNTGVTVNNVYFPTVLYGRYDPNLACSAYSQYAYSTNNVYTGTCKKINRYNAYYTYNCNSTAFKIKEYYPACEVGDFSGKFGNAVSSSLVFSSPGILTDKYPPLNVNFQTATTTSAPWASISFQCSTAQIACAQFQVIPDAQISGTTCAGAFAEMNAASGGNSGPPSSSASALSSDSVGYSASDFDAAVATSVLLCLFFGLLIGAGGMWCFLRRNSSSSDGGGLSSWLGSPFHFKGPTAFERPSTEYKACP